MVPESILIIDNDEEFLARTLDFLVVHMKLNNVIWAKSSEEAEEKMKIYNPGVVILDLGMEKVKGEEISSIINNRPNSPIIIMTSYYDFDEYLELTNELGGDGFFQKERLKTAFPKLMEYLNSESYTRDIFHNKSYLLN
jgi:DNA-binding NtrC family response regulator